MQVSEIHSALKQWKILLTYYEDDDMAIADAMVNPSKYCGIFMNTFGVLMQEWN